MRIICLDEPGQTFIDRPVMGLKYKDRHNTYYASDELSCQVRLEGRTTRDSSSRRIIRIMRLDQLSCQVRLKRSTTRDSSSRHIIRIVRVFILETHNQTNNLNVCLGSSRRIMRLKYKNGHCCKPNKV